MNFVHVINKESIVDVHVTKSGFETVGNVATRLPEFNLIINADGWYKGISNSIWYSGGRVKNRIQKDYRPWINFDRDNNFEFGWKRGSHWGNYNAVSGSRFIVENGVVNPKMSKSSELDARTAIGITHDGKLVIAVVDGRDIPNPEGLSLTGLAELMLNYNCEAAIDLDGGGSTTLALNGAVFNAPNDDGVYGQRSVINHLCFNILNLDGYDPPVDPPIDPPVDPSGDEYVLHVKNNITRKFVLEQ